MIIAEILKAVNDRHAIGGIDQTATRARRASARARVRASLRQLSDKKMMPVGEAGDKAEIDPLSRGPTTGMARCCATANGQPQRRSSLQEVQAHQLAR